MRRFVGPVHAQVAGAEHLAQLVAHQVDDALANPTEPAMPCWMLSITASSAARRSASARALRD